MTQILIVEDEDRIASFIELGLTAAGFTTHRARTGAEAVSLAQMQRVDLVVLDLGLPDMDGMDVLATLRGCGHEVPVVILTARTEIADLVAGFNGGAQDFLSKPFRFEELLVRVRARLTPPAARTSARIEAGEVCLDLTARRAYADGLEVELSSREFALTEEFLRHPGQVLSRTQLLDSVWGLDFDPGSNVVDVYVAYLRRKFGAHSIETVRGVGYRFAR